MGNTWNESAEFKCEGCKTIMPREEMSTDAESHDWCIECDEHEKEVAKRDEENDRDGYDDDYGPGGPYEDPYQAYERERGEAWEDRYLQWKREY